MLKKWTLRIVLGLLVLMAAIFATAPASLMKNQLMSRIPTLQINGADGYFRAGTFQLMSYRNKVVKQLSWNLSFVSLLSAKIGMQLSLNDALFKGGLFFELGNEGNIYVSNIQGTQSVDSLLSIWPVMKMFKPSGKIIWDDVNVDAQRQTIKQLSGNIQWNNAALNVYGENFNIGTVDIQLGMDKEDVLLHLSSDEILELTGTLRIKPDRKYVLQGSLSENMPVNIKNALAIMLKPEAQGRLSFNIPGKF